MYESFRAHHLQKNGCWRGGACICWGKRQEVWKASTSNTHSKFCFGEGMSKVQPNYLGGPRSKK